MKIYQGTHNIMQTESIDLNTDIPLAYINTQNEQYNISTLAVPNFDTTKKERVIPYEVFDSINVKLYDEGGAAVNSGLQRSGDKYVYVPSNAVTFEPQKFSYSIVGRKIMRYKSSNAYDIAVGCVDFSDNLDYSKKLMTMFGDAPTRKIAPQNIFVNHGDLSLQPLLNGSITEKQFVFIESFDGIHYKDYWISGSEYNMNSNVEYEGKRYLCISAHTAASFQSDISKWAEVKLYTSGTLYSINDYTEYKGDVYRCITVHNAGEFVSTYWNKIDVSGTLIPFNDFINNHTNVWMSVNGNSRYNIVPVSSIRNLKSPQVYESKPYPVKYYFDSVTKTTTDYNVIQLFSEDVGNVLIQEYNKKAFVIETHKSFLNEIADNSKLFYEILSYVYFNMYVKTAPINEWITDVVPDYIAVNGALIKKDNFSNNIDLAKLFYLEPGDVILADIIIDSENITYTNATDYSITFKKSITENHQKYADPVKPVNTLAVFTPRQNMMYFDKFVYKIIDAVPSKIAIKQQDGKYMIVNEAIKNSLFGIEVQAGSLDIVLTKTVNYEQVSIENVIMNLCCKENILSLVEEDNYTADKGIIIMKVVVRKTIEDVEVIDMRQRGGGLQESKEDDYSLLDIGSINGRAYRTAGVVVITLPKRLEQHKDLILKALEKHMIAEEYPILLFEEGEIND